MSINDQTTTQLDKTDLVARLYEPQVAPARDAFYASSTFRQISHPDVDAELLDRFLLHFCSLGVQMTQPVDGWIRGAGTRCVEVGYVELGQALIRHADHEADHHLMMIADTRRLVEMWNERHRAQDHVDADDLLSASMSPGVQRYVELHEQTIMSEAPQAQLAIEYEIELLSITAGPAFLGNVAAVCGPDRIAALSFLTDHIAVDEGHTVFNRRQLNAFLSRHPDVTGLGVAGVAALRAYGMFLDDCLERAAA